jgi:uncharacterized protein (TIGR02246 family)
MAQPPSATAVSVTATYRAFISAQNGRNAAALAPLLLEGEDFLWVTTTGQTIRGRDAAMERFAANWRGTWSLVPEFDAAAVIEVAPEVALLHVPVHFTFAPPGEEAQEVDIKWSGLFRKVGGGWRIAAIMLTAVAETTA